MAKAKSKKTVAKISSAAEARVSQITKKITDLNKKIGLTYQVTEIAVAVLLTILVLQFKYLLVPAEVNGDVIPAWQYVQAMHDSSGRDVLDQLIIENLIRQEAENNNLVISKEQIATEVASLEEQFSASGGLDSVLAAQGLSRSDLDKQMELNLMVENLLAGSVEVTEAEVEEYYETNSSLYEDVSGEEARELIRSQLQDSKMQQQIGTWLQELRSKATVKIFLPGFDTL